MPCPLAASALAAGQFPREPSRAVLPGPLCCPPGGVPQAGAVREPPAAEVCWPGRGKPVPSSACPQAAAVLSQGFCSLSCRRALRHVAEGLTDSSLLSLPSLPGAADWHNRRRARAAASPGCPLQPCSKVLFSPTFSFLKQSVLPAQVCQAETFLTFPSQQAGFVQQQNPSRRKVSLCPEPPGCSVVVLLGKRQAWTRQRQLKGWQRERP